MLTRYSVWLNGAGLQDVDPTVYVLDVQEQTPQSQIKTAPWAAGRDGTRFIREAIMTRSVTVTFAVRERDAERRKMVISDIAAWAENGGMLTINDRPGQRLRVRCTSRPVTTSALKWTTTLSVVFTAYEWPWWEDEVAATARVNERTEATLSLNVPGNGRYAYLSGSLSFPGTSTVTVAVDGAHFEMRNITGGMTWGYEGGVLFIRDGSGASVLAHRTPESSDDLKVIPGKTNRIEVTSTAPVTGSVSSRGCYL